MSESGYRFGGTAVGEPLGRIYGYKTSHIIESEAQADAALYDSNSHGYRRSDGLSIAGRKDVGDYEWKNRAGSALTADGREQINGEDMFLLGNVVPHSTGGMNNTFKFRNPDPVGLPRLCAGTFDLQLPVYTLLPDLDGQLQLESGLRRPEYMAEARRRHQVRPPDSPTTPTAATATIRAFRISTCRRPITSACAT